DLMTKIIRATPAKVDQDHIRMLVDNNPHVSPRVEAIMGQGESPGPVMAAMAKNLAKWGADFLVIACNTAHYYFQDVVQAVQVPVLNMIEETVKVLEKDGVQEAALLATQAILHTKLYEKALSLAGIRTIVPSEPYQAKVLQTIAAVKRGDFIKAQRFTDEIIKHCLDQGAQVVILGCTELPLVFNQKGNFPITFYDPTEIVAQAIVREALG
ncbi:MAG: aspartate/glutamate racemase family protein, partial [Bacillota bacterium]